MQVWVIGLIIGLCLFMGYWLGNKEFRVKLSNAMNDFDTAVKSLNKDFRDEQRRWYRQKRVLREQIRQPLETDYKLIEDNDK